jgi:hypothetical protein
VVVAASSTLAGAPVVRQTAPRVEAVPA